MHRDRLHDLPVDVLHNIFKIVGVNRRDASSLRLCSRHSCEAVDSSCMATRATLRNRPRGDATGEDLRRLLDRVGARLTHIDVIHCPTNATAAIPRDVWLRDVLPLCPGLEVFRDPTGSPSSQLSHVSHRSHLRTLDARCCTALLPRMRSLRELRLDTIFIEDLTPLSALSSLTKLDLGSGVLSGLCPVVWMFPCVSSLAPLKTMTALASLRLGSFEVVDISALSTMPSLLHLDIRSCYGFADLTPLSALTMLETLLWEGVSCTRGPSAYAAMYAPLGRMTRLRRLSTDVKSVSAMGPLYALLEDLRLKSDREDVSLAQLGRRTPSVRSLALSGMGFSGFSGIADGFAGLERLDVSNTSFDVHGLASLSGARLLRELRARDCLGLRSLQPLTALVRLRALDLTRSSPSHLLDATPLSACTDMRRLGLRGTPLSSLSPLSALTRLRWLTCPTPCPDVSPLLLCADLRRLGIGVSISSSRITEAMADVIGRLPYLRYLDCYSCTLDDDACSLAARLLGARVNTFHVMKFDEDEDEDEDDE